MSVQLILFPQNYEGQYSTISTPFFNQYVSNFSFNSQYSVAYNMSSATNLPLDFLESVLPQNYWSLFIVQVVYMELLKYLLKQKN